MKVLQINTTYNIGSTGRIVAGIDDILVNSGIESYVAYGYGNLQDDRHYKIINQLDSYCHNIMSRLTDGQGLYSTLKTKKLINWIETINPDIIHLHNLHGNYLNYKILFNYIKTKSFKVVWTFHDCWPFTGHCAYFDMADCGKWKNGCHKCAQTKCYPPAIYDNSSRNYKLKKDLFTALGDRLILVPVSNWLAKLIKESYLKECHIFVVHNGIDLKNFYWKKYITTKPYVLGVASPWDTRKGLKDFYKFRKILSREIDIVLVGLTTKQIKELPEGIQGITRTESVADLARVYSGALAFINTTYEDNYPTVNLESIACGTPVITYQTGGSPEAVSEQCGIVVPKGDVLGLKNAVDYIYEHQDLYSRKNLMAFANLHFNQTECFKSYLNLYKSAF